MLEDSGELRGFINEIYPSFEISDIAKKSGQRVVYFGRFVSCTEVEPDGCELWGDVVLKISEANSRAAISYIQKEVEILKDIENPKYPKLYFSELLSSDPITEETLDIIRFVSFEEKLLATPLTSIMDDFDTEVKVVDFLIQIVRAMDLLWNHPQKLVHRDLKPDNILIKDNGEVNIIDLGILREEGSAGVTNSFNSMGPCTPLYASPEQAKNDKRNITFKSDVFSIGVIAYEMLSGANPFIDDSGSNYVDEILERVCSLKPKSLSEFGVSVELSMIVEKMISKEPYKRYRASRKLLEELSGLNVG
ncbi:serine/threonine protein kinase [Enterovibrio baiacu]|uniref:serine/threonine protein kinase n=1 Tax=Enterovibrio baiacu TaxID=2491023 RepID=UPI003D09EEBC